MAQNTATGVSQVRKERLRQWIGDEFGGNVARFVRYYNLGRSMASYISQLFAGLRGFGEKAARNIEEAAGRPTGWLDMTEENARQIETMIELPIFRYNKADAARLPEKYKNSVSDYIAYIISKHQAESGGKKPAQTIEIDNTKYNSASAKAVKPREGIRKTFERVTTGEERKSRKKAG